MNLIVFCLVSTLAAQLIGVQVSAFVTDSEENYTEGHIDDLKFVYVGSVNGKSYYAEKGSYTWFEVRKLCYDYGLEMATVITPDEVAFLKSAYKEETFSYNHWLGARDSKHPEALSWDMTGEEVKNENGANWYYYGDEYQLCSKYDANIALFQIVPCDQQANALCQTST